MFGAASSRAWAACVCLEVRGRPGLMTRRYVDYRESSAWAVEASPVVDALADAVAGELSSELVPLLERAVGHVVKVILRADDSDGMIGELARGLLDLHERACDVVWPIRRRWRSGCFASTSSIRTSSPPIRSATPRHSGRTAWRSSAVSSSRGPMGRRRSPRGTRASVRRSSMATSTGSCRCSAVICRRPIIQGRR